LPLLGELGQPFADLGMGYEIGPDRLGPVCRKPAIDIGHQLVVADRTREIGHFTFPS
jgi:hypothetical protein